MVLCTRNTAFSYGPIDLITSHTTGLRPVLAADPSTKRIAFGWTMPLIWSWQPIINLGALSAVVVAVTLILALAQMRRYINRAVREMSGASA